MPEEAKFLLLKEFLLMKTNQVELDENRDISTHGSVKKEAFQRTEIIGAHFGVVVPAFQKDFDVQIEWFRKGVNQTKYPPNLHFNAEHLPHYSGTTETFSNKTVDKIYFDYFLIGYWSDQLKSARHGVVHCDGHIGNILYLDNFSKNGNISFARTDFGTTTSSTESQMKSDVKQY